MANPNDIQRLLAGDKDLQGADLSRFNFDKEGIYNVKDVDFRGADFTGSLLRGFDCVKCDFRGAKFYGTSFGYNTFHKCDFRDVEFNSSWGRDVDFQGSDLEGASGIPFKTLYGLANDGGHKGETVEEKARREEEGGRRASQIRTASQMLKQLNKEIVDLKKEL